jgi:exopolysaccharide production protein ExoZ
MKADKRSLHLLQVVRGVAAVMVVILHASTLVTERFGNGKEIWWSGAAGVDIFFVISGFVMALSSVSLTRSASPALEFMKRRLERIVPLYWIFTTFKIALLSAVPAVALRGLGGSWHVLSSYLFIPSKNAIGSVLPVLSVGWTLNFEMLFYVLFAAALSFKISPLKMVAPVLVILSLVPVITRTDTVAILSWCHPIVLEFLFGMLLYAFWSQGRKLNPAVAWSLLFVGAILIAVIPWGWQSLLRPFVWGLPALAIVTAAVELEGPLGAKAPRWMLKVGDASYSIYLTHVFVLPVVAAGLLRIPIPALRTMAPVILISLVTSLSTGVIVHQIIELPIIDYFRNRRLKARSIPI